jgi:hypothetical protein
VEHKDLKNTIVIRVSQFEKLTFEVEANANSQVDEHKLVISETQGMEQEQSRGFQGRQLIE